MRRIAALVNTGDGGEWNPPARLEGALFSRYVGDSSCCSYLLRLRYVKGIDVPRRAYEYARGRCCLASQHILDTAIPVATEGVVRRPAVSIRIKVVWLSRVRNRCYQSRGFEVESCGFGVDPCGLLA